MPDQVQQTHAAVAPDQIEQAVARAIHLRVIGDHALEAGHGDLRVKGAIKLDPAAIKAKFDAFEPKLKQFLQLVGPVSQSALPAVVSAALAFYDAVNGALGGQPAPAAG